MTEIVKIGDIVLDHPLFLEESFKPKKTQAVAFETLGGGRIVQETYKRNSANDVTLMSGDHRWIKESTLRSIYELLDDIGVEVGVTAKDGSVMVCRFRLEDDPIEYEQIYEGSEWYKVTIKMARLQ